VGHALLPGRDAHEVHVMPLGCVTGQ
jgi:hypothetical protein